MSESERLLKIANRAGYVRRSHDGNCGGEAIDNHDFPPTECRDYTRSGRMARANGTGLLTFAVRVRLLPQE